MAFSHRGQSRKAYACCLRKYTFIFSRTSRLKLLIIINLCLIGGPAVASFITTRSKSGTTNLPEGIVHIYRELPHQTYSSVAATSHPPITQATQAGGDKKKVENDGVLMGVLAVPSWMTPSDFLAFVAPAAEGITHLRMIRYVDST